MTTPWRSCAGALAAGAILLALGPPTTAAAAPPAEAPATPAEEKAVISSHDGDAELNLVFVLDGLRPDSINAQDTPTIHRLREGGAEFTNSHAITPTVTRVNASAIGTGNFPSATGIVGNSMYVPQVDPDEAFSTGDATNLVELFEETGSIVLTDTLAERLHTNGRELVAIGSGSSGSSMLLNPSAIEGTGVMINTGDPGGMTPFAFPEEVGAEILDRFGPPPSKDDVPNSNASVDYATKVLNEYVLTELQPEVILNWMTEPDGSQHEFGAGSPEAIETIRNDDRNIGLVLDQLQALGLAESTNIFVISDHGFSLTTEAVNVEQALIDAGLKEGPHSDDVIVADTGAALVYVRDRDPERIDAIAEFLQAQAWSDVVFTAAEQPVDGQWVAAPAGEATEETAQGWVDGTLSLELIHEANPERGADLLVTFPWTSEENQFGLPGTASTSTSGESGLREGPGSGHGSFSPWDVRNTFIAWGPDIKDGISSPVPAGNVDIAPTILKLAGAAADDELDGRVLAEALTGGPDPYKVPSETHVISTDVGDGATRALVRVSIAGGTRYIDTAWREDVQ